MPPPPLSPPSLLTHHLLLVLTTTSPRAYNYPPPALCLTLPLSPYLHPTTSSCSQVSSASCLLRLSLYICISIYMYIYVYLYIHIYICRVHGRKAVHGLRVNPSSSHRCAVPTYHSDHCLPSPNLKPGPAPEEVRVGLTPG